MNTNARMPGQTPSNLPPVGDIKLTKVKETFNTYKLELSYGQIEAIQQALEKDHANPISDELLAIFGYYLAKVPGPGQDEEAKNAETAAPAVDAGFGGQGGQGGPIADLGGQGGEPLPLPPEDDGMGDEGFEPGAPEGDLPPEGAPGEEDIDSALPPPPSEAPGEEDEGAELPEPKAEMAPPKRSKSKAKGDADKQLPEPPAE